MREPREHKETESRRAEGKEQGKGKHIDRYGKPIEREYLIAASPSAGYLSSNCYSPGDGQQPNNQQDVLYTTESMVKLSCGRRVSGARRPEVQGKQTTRAIRQQAGSLRRYMMLHIQGRSVYRYVILPPRICNMVYLSMVMYDLVAILFVKEIFCE